MRSVLARVAFGFAAITMVSPDAAAQGRQTGPPLRQHQTDEGKRLGTAARAAFERAAKNQENIRSLTKDLKSQLLQLNKLRQLPEKEAASPSVTKEIEARKVAILKLATTIYGLMVGDGLASAILNERSALEAIQRNSGLPLSEQQELEKQDSPTIR